MRRRSEVCLFPFILLSVVQCTYSVRVHGSTSECRAGQDKTRNNLWLTGIVAFAQCAVNRTITATWVCRDQRLAMNGCMVAHAKPEEADRAREEWFAGVEERRRLRDEENRRVGKRREEVIRMMREDEERRTRSTG